MWHVLDEDPRLAKAHDTDATRSRIAVWRDIRALRHHPPGRADRGDRRRVFGSALEQAEQLFTTAETAGYASRPILLFYGLSQAGRAIAAASTAADNASYRLTGHGIESPNLSQRPDLHRLLLADKGKGSFTQLATLLESSSLPQPTTFGQIWAVIPDLLGEPIDASGSEYKTVLTVDDAEGAKYGWAHSGQVADRTIGWIIGLPRRFGKLPRPDEEELSSYLNFYPTLREPMNPGADNASSIFADSEAALIQRTWATREWGLTERLVEKVTQPYRADHDRWVFPALDRGSQPLHPLLAWWALLYALSMLARYEPASWTADLNVDTSPVGVALEAALGHALDTCPALILRAIEQVSDEEVPD
jgi:hypothetical protein